MFYLDVVNKSDINKLKYWYKKNFKLISIEYIGNKEAIYGTNVDNLNLKISLKSIKHQEKL